ncbi:MAG TPA: GNAT family N-acetyltransferase [Solirubrobacteraceae bacterium]|nr:GNAT family N-acetyltransferase [Solirubrobacteraceae bacterium]
MAPVVRLAVVKLNDTRVRGDKTPRGADLPIRWATDPEDVRGAIALREQVFCDELALAAARERGCVRARLAAQLEAVALYEQAGFAVESEQFEEAGIPHVWMGRRLQRLVRSAGERTIYGGEH